MFDTRQAAPACVYLLGDHLDAALAAGEDLMATALAIGDPGPVASQESELAARQAELAGFLGRLRALEAAVVARVVQARCRVEEIPRPDGPLKALSSLFLSGTAVLLEAVEDFGGRSGSAFHIGGDGVHFLRARGLIADDAAGIPLSGTLAADEDYLIAGRVRLGSLMDLIASFLDALDMRFSLYDEDIADVPRIAVETATPVVFAQTESAHEGLAGTANRPRLVAEALDALYGRN